MQSNSALLVPEPICNHIDIVHFDHDGQPHGTQIPGANHQPSACNEKDVLIDQGSISSVQLSEVPADNLLDHVPALAAMDGIPGLQSALAPLNSEPPLAHYGGLASACNYSSPHAVDPTD